MQKNKKNSVIDPSRWYTIKNLRDEGLIPWRKSLPGIRQLVLADKGSKDILKTAIQGRGQNTRYHIKGDNLIRFLAAVEDGSYQL